MKFEDIKVGDVVTTNRSVYNGDYTVVAIKGNSIILDVLEQTDSHWNNTLDKDTLWAVGFETIVDIVDPEEDLIVWGALEVGEHFKWNRGDSKECVKIAPRAYMVLGYPILYIFSASSATKVKLL